MKKIATLITIACFVASSPGFAQDNLMLNNALLFLDTPYAAGTLEVNAEEELVVNCDSVDCTTLVEYVLAMALCPQQGNDMLESDFAHNLQQIRYRGGEIKGYTSRLHYMTDWISDNIRKGFIEDITAKNSNATTTVDVNYMSTHPEKYAQLQKSNEDLEKMAEIEKEISGQKVSWLPKENLPIKGLPWIKNGDIIAITTNIPGLDVSHVGIAIYINETLHLLHASSKEKKVVVEKTTLSRQIARSKTATGIRVLRMKKSH